MKLSQFVSLTVLAFFFTLFAWVETRAEFITDSTPVPAPGSLGGPELPLSVVEEQQFRDGRRIFDRDWKISQGLGEDLNGDSCRSCHQDPVVGGSGGVDVNVFRFANDNGGAGPFTNLAGGQIASKLRIPSIPGREEHDSASDVFEQRNSPSILGLGLIDDILDSVILAGEDINDSDDDGIFGVARLVDVAGFTEVGRFGWKAGVPHLQDFISDAMGNELGITAPDDGRGFAFLTDSDALLDPEISQPEFDDLLFFMRSLAAPKRQNPQDPDVVLGEEVFHLVGCATCHTPSLAGASGPVNLYSNLLLHDIHPDGFRGMADPGIAGVGMYRTAPLWGVRHTAPYFHDGSAETLQDAIQRHRGEADISRQFYNSLTIQQREAMIKFLEDL